MGVDANRVVIWSFIASSGHYTATCLGCDPMPAQECAAGELAAAATGRVAVRCTRQWYRRAWPAQHDWSRLTLDDVEDDRPRRETGGFPFAGDGSELRSQHSAVEACRGLTDCCIV